MIAKELSATNNIIIRDSILLLYENKSQQTLDLLTKKTFLMSIVLHPQESIRDRSTRNKAKFCNKNLKALHPFYTVWRARILEGPNWLLMPKNVKNGWYTLDTRSVE